MASKIMTTKVMTTKAMQMKQLAGEKPKNKEEAMTTKEVMTTNLEIMVQMSGEEEATKGQTGRTTKTIPMTMTNGVKISFQAITAGNLTEIAHFHKRQQTAKLQNVLKQQK